MLYLPIKSKAKTILLSLAVIILMITSNGIAQGFSKYSLPFYLEQKTYPLSLDRKYDAAKVTSVTGDINNIFYVEYYTPNKNFRIIGLELKTDQGKAYQIHLAPLPWLENNEVPIQKGTKITVKGSMISSGQESILLAANLCWKGKSVNLRYRDGRWLWDIPRHSMMIN